MSKKEHAKNVSLKVVFREYMDNKTKLERWQWGWVGCVLDVCRGFSKV